MATPLVKKDDYTIVGHPRNGLGFRLISKKKAEVTKHSSGALLGTIKVGQDKEFNGKLYKLSERDDAGCVWANQAVDWEKEHAKANARRNK